MLEEQKCFFSQYDFFVYFFQLIDRTVGNVPKIVDKNDQEGLVLMEYMGDVRCKEFILSKPHTMIEMYQRMIDWLIKFSKLDINDKMIQSRTYTTYSMETEINNFRKYGLNWMNSVDRNIFVREICNFLEYLEDTVPR